MGIIDTELQQIQVAAYGADVRIAMHDALDKLDSYVEDIETVNIDHNGTFSSGTITLKRVGKIVCITGSGIGLTMNKGNESTIFTIPTKFIPFASIYITQSYPVSYSEGAWSIGNSRFTLNPNGNCYFYNGIVNNPTNIAFSGTYITT